MSDKQGAIKFLDYRVSKVEFYLNKTEKQSNELNVEVSSDKEVDKELKNMLVELNVEIGDKDESPFFMSICLEGLFELSQDYLDYDINLFYSNALSIMYPYVRAIVSTYTAGANIKPVILPTINIKKMLK
jgi:preprotein translocase subunit secB